VRALLALALAVSASSCLSLNWTRDTRSESIDPEWSALEPGAAQLDDALALLGAPLYVYEHEHSGAVLVWARRRADDKGFNVSVPVSDQGGSLDFDYSRRTAALRGVLMVFDAEWRLQLAREGLLHDLTAGRGARPSAPLLPDAVPAQEANER
jgi:hypothetical protein